MKFQNYHHAKAILGRPKLRRIIFKEMQTFLYLWIHMYLYLRDSTGFVIIKLPIMANWIEIFLIMPFLSITFDWLKTLWTTWFQCSLSKTCLLKKKDILYKLDVFSLDFLNCSFRVGPKIFCSPQNDSGFFCFRFH